MGHSSDGSHESHEKACCEGSGSEVKAEGQSSSCKDGQGVDKNDSQTKHAGGCQAARLPQLERVVLSGRDGSRVAEEGRFGIHLEVSGLMVGAQGPELHRGLEKSAGVEE